MRELKPDLKKGIVNTGNLSRIRSCMERANAGEHITVAFLGGSITQGSLSETPQTCYAYLVYEWWKARYPKASVSYLNAGIGGTDSALGVARVEEEVLSAQPDFVIVEFSVNDEAKNPMLQETYEGLLRKILGFSSKPAVLLLHNVCYDTGTNAEEIHVPVGKYYDLPCISIRPVVYPAIEQGELTVSTVSPDGLHPNDKGHRIVADTVISFLEEAEKAPMEYRKEDVWENLPAPMTPNRYEQAVRKRNDQLLPDVCIGFQRDDRQQKGIADCFTKGYRGKKLQDRICFTIACRGILLQYRKTVRRPAPIAKVTVDGNDEQAKLLDANFTQDWGDCLYLETVLLPGEYKTHRVEIEIVQAKDTDKEDFYLVSLITL